MSSNTSKAHIFLNISTPLRGRGDNATYPETQAKLKTVPGLWPLIRRRDPEKPARGQTIRTCNGPDRGLKDCDSLVSVSFPEMNDLDKHV